ncbi:MAG: hypothetical protein GX279_11095 [Clostridiaceae bacterium]|nr:hypothetical protein [Clostridiaceae bacterium]
MLEILAIAWLCNVNKKNAAQRGRKPGGFVALTVVLWVGLELLAIVIGVAAGMEVGVYLLAILFAGIGGLTSYLIAKNCRTGDYISPQDKAIADIINSPEYLDTPATIEIMREKRFAGALMDYPLKLNGQRLASIPNGGSITVQTISRHNILSASDTYGTELKPFLFDMESGGYATIRFKAGKFAPIATGTLPVSLYTDNNGSGVISQ